jgi:hypothetical protein
MAYKKMLITLFAAIMIVCFGCNSGGSNNPPAPPRNNVPASIEQKAQALTRNLENQGFEVKRGYFYLFTIADCEYAINIMGNCFGNNPVAPYINYAVPPWPEEYVDQTLTNLFGRTEPGYNSVFRFDPREAVIILGQLPPPAAYFGLQHFQFTREGTINTNDPIYIWLGSTGPMMQKLFFDYAPDPTRLRIFASIGNNNNNVVVERQSGASFGQERYFVITPDQYMARTMTQYLRNAGVPDTRQIFMEPVNSTLQVGLQKSAYDFIFLMRYAMPTNKTDADTWRSNLPLVVLRVRDKNLNRQPEPYPGPSLEPRLANNELYLQPDLNNLALALKDHWNQPAAPQPGTFDAQTKVDMVGPDCEQRGMNCQGDTQDTAYIGSFNCSLDNQEVYAVLGTMGTVTGNATYVNLSIYEAAEFYGVQSIDNTQIQGTATQFCAGADCTGVNNVDKFYLFYITRDCQSLGLSNCYSVGTDEVPTGHFFKIVQRTYIKPGTERGPDSSQLVLPIMVQLDGSKM